METTTYVLTKRDDKQKFIMTEAVFEEIKKRLGEDVLLHRFEVAKVIWWKGNGQPVHQR